MSGARSDQFVDGCRRCLHRLGVDLDTRLLEQLGDFAALRLEADRDDGPLGTRACRATRPVQVGLVLDGGIDVDDELDLVDVHAAGCDIRRYQHPDAVVLGRRGERGKVPVPRVLREVSVQVDSGDACRGELFGKLLGLVLGAREQDATSLTRGELADERGLLFSSGDQEHAVGHLPRGDARLVDLVAHRRGQEPASEHIDAAVESRAEQEALTVGRRRGEDPRDAREEAEVGHVVCLVEHADFDAVKAHDLLLHQVFEAPGARYDDVDARAKRLLLRALADAAEDRRDPQAHGVCQRLDGRGDLCCELPRGGQHQTPRTPGG